MLAIGDTLNLLPTQEQQLECMRRFAAKLTPDGVFVVEGIAAKPPPPGGSVTVQRVDQDEVVLVVAQGDPSSDATRGAHVVIRTNGIRIIPIFGRNIPPPELDLMASLAGLRLRERWGGWTRERFGPSSAGRSRSTSASRSHAL